jgi:uncharacterized membrane protein
MKKYFITGLIILLPLALTIWFFSFIVNLLTEPFMGGIQLFFNKLGILQEGFLFLSAGQAQKLVSQLLILVLLVGFTILLGVITRYFFFKSALRFWDWLVLKIPLISPVYKAAKDLIDTLLGSDSSAFKKVVMVPFPDKNNYTIGFVTREEVKGVTDLNLIAVFVPTAPNPTSGFLILFSPEDVMFLDMKVEEAFKYVISCGVIATNFEKKTV